MGFDGENVIVKVAAEGDGRLSYDALYDTCLTLRDLKRMQEAKALLDAVLAAARQDGDLVVHVHEAHRVHPDDSLKPDGPQWEFPDQ
jgi:nicotinamidase-related amidase